METPTLPDPPHKEKGYWGNLTPEQEEALKTVKEKMKDVLTEHYDDARLLRFLRARGFDASAAEIMLRDDITWRKENDVDNILETFPKSAYGKQLIGNYPSFVHKTDKYGLPLTIERITAIDPKTLFAAIPSEELVKMRIYTMEVLENMIQEASKKAGRPMDYGIIAIVDVTELGWRHMYTPGLNTVKKALANDKNHYPEVLRKLLIVGCPRIFGMFWTIFKPILDPRTVEKTEIHTGSGFHQLLANNMAITHIPKPYGGKCDNPDHQPNCWTYGCTNWKSDKRSSVNENQHVSVHVKARSHYEVSCNIDKAKTSIALEFSVEAHDIKFKLFKKNGPKEFVDIVKETDVNHSEPYQTTIVVEEPGEYVLHWDNSGSLLRSKQVSYLLELIPPEETEEKTISNEN